MQRPRTLKQQVVLGNLQQGSNEEWAGESRRTGLGVGWTPSGQAEHANREKQAPPPIASGGGRWETQGKLEARGETPMREGAMLRNVPKPGVGVSEELTVPRSCGRQKCSSRPRGSVTG